MIVVPAELNKQAPLLANTIGQPTATTNTAQNKTTVNKTESTIREITICMLLTCHPTKVVKSS